MLNSRSSQEEIRDFLRTSDGALLSARGVMHMMQNAMASFPPLALIIWLPWGVVYLLSRLLVKKQDIAVRWLESARQKDAT